MLLADISRKQLSVSEINAFWGFTQKLKIAAKKGENIFGKKFRMTTYTLWAKNFIKIALSCTVSELSKIFNFHR